MLQSFTLAVINSYYKIPHSVKIKRVNFICLLDKTSSKYLMISTFLFVTIFTQRKNPSNDRNDSF